MDHREAQALVSEYVAGLLNGRRLERFVVHLNQCRVCQRETLALWRLTESLERHVPETLAPEPPAGVTLRVVDTVRHAMPAPLSPWRRWVAVSGAAVGALVGRWPSQVASLTVLAVVLLGVGVAAAVMRPLSTEDTLPLSLETPVRGTLTVAQDTPVATGTFDYVATDRWWQRLTLHRLPQGVRYVEEMQIGDRRFHRFGEQDRWGVSSPMPPDLALFPTLTDIGSPGGLFAAILQLYDIERRTTTILDGQLVHVYEGKDTGYAYRLRERLKSTVAEDSLDERIRLYAEHPPRVWVYTDAQNRILSVVVVAPSADGGQPSFTFINITETNAPVSIVPPYLLSSN